MLEYKGKYTSARVMIDDIESSCAAQIVEFINHPAFTNECVIMPDTHAGKGSVVGFTMKIGNRIVPNTVGVDISCGMLGMDLGKIEPDCVVWDRIIRRFVPFGFEIHESPVYKDWYIEKYFEGYNIKETLNRIGMDYNYFMQSIGTIGGGNHFIEFSKSSNTNHMWVVIHTGSRNLGKKICEYWSRIAKKRLDDCRSRELMDGIKSIVTSGEKSTINDRIKALKQSLGIGSVGSGMEWLEGTDAEGYLCDMKFAQKYAELNRKTVLDLICRSLFLNYGQTIETIHNYIDFSDNIIRKGAIRAYVGELCLIPLTPKDGTLICEGTSNPDWNYSAPHGCGRLMSRSQAKKELDDDIVDEAMAGVYASVKPKDESPLVYKDSKVIEAAIEPTVTILDRLIPVMNLKTGDGA